MSVLREIGQVLGLLPRDWVCPEGAPDRSLVRDRPVEENVTNGRINWGKEKPEGYKVDHATGATWTRSANSGPAAPGHIPLNLYDVQQFNRAQAKTKSFTWAQYLQLRQLLCDEGVLKTKQVADKMNMGVRWTEYRWPSVKKAIALAQADIKKNKSLPPMPSSKRAKRTA